MGKTILRTPQRFALFPTRATKICDSSLHSGDSRGNNFKRQRFPTSKLRTSRSYRKGNASFRFRNSSILSVLLDNILIRHRRQPSCLVCDTGHWVISICLRHGGIRLLQFSLYTPYKESRSAIPLILKLDKRQC